MRYFDFRSDTLTKPTEAMRRVMAEAEVGDDVFGQDPTINRLQKRVAELCGKQAALFVPSGTMSNQIAINAHTQPGDEVICDINSHIFNYEGGGPAVLSGVQLHPLHGNNGILSAEQIEPAIRNKADHHFPRTQLIEIENTHNRGGGNVYPIEDMRAVYHLAQQHQLKVHLDGARLWNAQIASGISLREYGNYADSISLCFSKGLGAPVGSILVGDAEFIDRAHRYRKMYGGGMRQAGILAAAAEYALDHHWQRMADDHSRAQQIAEALIKAGAKVNMAATCTNIVIADVAQIADSAKTIEEKLAERGILGIAMSQTKIRFVTHLDVRQDDVNETVKIIESL